MQICGDQKIGEWLLWMQLLLLLCYLAHASLDNKLFAAPYIMNSGQDLWISWLLLIKSIVEKVIAMLLWLVG